MQREGSYGNSHTDTTVEAEGNLSATDPDWLIENDPDLPDLTEAEFKDFERAVDEGLRRQHRS